MAATKRRRSKRVTPLRRPVTRRIGRLVVTIAPDGIRFRGKHKRTWRTVSWAQVASLAEDAPIFLAEETSRGLRELERMGAYPTTEETADA